MYTVELLTVNCKPNRIQIHYQNNKIVLVYSVFGWSNVLKGNDRDICIVLSILALSTNRRNVSRYDYIEKQRRFPWNSSFAIKKLLLITTSGYSNEGSG